MRLYRSKEHPSHWIGEDAHGVLMIWPAVTRGWMKRTGYAGPKRALEEIEPALARGSGWPGGGRGPAPRSAKGATSKPIGLRVTEEERADWRSAAGERPLSDWIRDVCNTAAAAAKRSKSKP